MLFLDFVFGRFCFCRVGIKDVRLYWEAIEGWN